MVAKNLKRYDDARAAIYQINGTVFVVGYGIDWRRALDIVKTTDYAAYNSGHYAVIADGMSEHAVVDATIQMIESGDKDVRKSLDDYLAYHGLL